MGRASLIIVAGFIMAFGFMNYSMTNTGTSIVNNYTQSYQRTEAQNANFSGIQYYIKRLGDDQTTIPRTDPYALSMNINDDNVQTNVRVQKLTAVKPDTFKVTGTTHYGPDQDSVTAWAYVTPIELEFPPIYGAVRTFDSVATFDFAGSPTKVHGQDTDTTGLPSESGITLPAFNASNAADSARLAAAISKPGIISGAGNPPISVAKEDQSFDVFKYVDQLTAMANQTLTETSITGSTANLGTVTEPRITVLAPPQSTPGDNPQVKISGSISGAGVLIVKADLWVSGTFDFKGLVLVVGNRTIEFEATGTPRIFGAMMVAGKLLDFVSKGNGDIYYSSQALKIIKDRMGTGQMKTICWWE